VLTVILVFLLGVTGIGAIALLVWIVVTKGDFLMAYQLDEHDQTSSIFFDVARNGYKNCKQHFFSWDGD